jgi:hypothetical protein
MPSSLRTDAIVRNAFSFAMALPRMQLDLSRDVDNSPMWLFIFAQASFLSFFFPSASSHFPARLSRSRT